MRDNRWILFLTITLILSLLFGFITPVLAKDTTYRIDFGKAEPWEETMIERSLLIRSVSPDFNSITVETDPDLVNASGRKISAHRLKLAVNNQLFSLGDAPVKIKKTQLTPGNILNFQVKLILEPQDAPGIYQGNFMIRVEGDNSRDNLIVEMFVEVKPWVRMEANTTLLILDQLGKEHSVLQNSKPLEINVASNTDWVLYVTLPKSATKLDDRKITIKALAASRIQTEPEFVLSSKDGRRRLAIGTQTTVRGYWDQIILAVMVKDLIKLPAGRYNFEIFLKLEQWK